MANRALANKRERATREHREAAAIESHKHLCLASDRGDIGKPDVPSYDGAMVARYDGGEAAGLAQDIGRCGKANRVRARNTYGDGTRRLGVDLVACSARGQGWQIVPAPKRKRR